MAIFQETQITVSFVPTYDMGIGILVVFLATLWPILLFIPAFFIEGIVLKRLEATSSPFTTSFVMNLITTLLGIPVGYAVAALVIALMNSSNYASAETFVFLSSLLVFFLSWLFSVLVEGVILIWIYHLPAQQSWEISGKANSASYLVGLTVLGIYYLSA